MVPIRKVYWLWLGLGVAVFFHGVNTGGGVAGILLYRELEWLGEVFPATHLLLSIPLIFLPIILLAQGADRRRIAPIDVAASAKRLGKWFKIGGLILAGSAGLCYWRTTLLPNPYAIPQRIVVDDVPRAGPVPEYRSVLVGTPQRRYGVRYDEVLRGRFKSSTHWPHNFVPVTQPDWTPDRPVRFLVDTRGNPLSSVFSLDGNSLGQRYASERGLLLRGQLPGFVRIALRKKGLQIADDVMVLSSDRDFGRTAWYVSTAFCSIGAFLGLALGWVWPKAPGLSEEQRVAISIRVSRFLAFGLGGVLILLSAVLAARKGVHIVRAASVDGVITGAQVASHSIGKYSFYVEYNTPEGRFHRFAHTWTPFAKEVGDKVVVLYNRDTPGNPEILAFDDEWAAYAILFLPGAVIVILGGILFRRRAR